MMNLVIEGSLLGLSVALMLVVVMSVAQAPPVCNAAVAAVSFFGILGLYLDTERRKLR